MNKFFVCALLSLLCCNLFSLSATYKPSEGVVLNINQFFFEIPSSPTAEMYEVSVQRATDKTPFVLQSATNAIWVDNLKFNSSYTWKWRSIANKQASSWSKEHAFSLGTCRFIDTTAYRLKVLKHDPACTLKYLTIDGTGTIVNQNGEVVWYLPDDMKVTRVSEMGRVRDLRITPYGTLSFLNYNDGYEITLTNDSIWKTPYIDQSKGQYHHDFQVFKNGNKGVLVNDFLEKRVIRQRRSKEDENADSVVYKRYEQGGLLIFDLSGREVFRWSSKDYFSEAELNIFQERDGAPFTSSHLNSFCEDKTGNGYYLSFRTLSRCTHLDNYGKPDFSFGKVYPQGGATIVADFFQFQHSITEIGKDTFLLFNNNNNDRLKSATRKLSSVELLTLEKNKVKKLWSYACSSPDLKDSVSLKMGNADRISNNEYLVCMGDNNSIFIVDKNKKMLWHGENQYYKKEDNSWHPLGSYRAHAFNSLYPYFFSAELKQIAKKKTIVLTNLGAATDDYSLYEGDKLIKKITIVANENMVIDASTIKGTIKIVSANNPYQQRTLPL